MNTGLNISINNICNNNCSYCFQSTYNNKQEKKLITLEHYEEILKFLYGSQIEHINILGGEPTLHPELLKIIDLTYKYNFSCLLITNLLVYDENFFADIVSKNTRMLINGTQTKKTRPLFEKNLKYFYENSCRGAESAISFCLTGNESEDNITINYIEYLCENFHQYPLHFRISPAAPNNKNFQLINFSEKYKQIDNILKKYNIVFNFDCNINYCQINYNIILNTLDSIDDNLETYERFATPCEGALDILLDDKLYFCNSIKDIGVSVFNYNNFAEAYADLMIQLSQMINGSPYQYCDENCQKRNYCIGPCPAQIYAFKKKKELEND